MKEFLEKGCQVVRGDSTMEGLNASHMMFPVPTMYIWPSSVIRFDSHAQLMDICGVCINVRVSDKKYYFCISKYVSAGFYACLLLTSAQYVIWWCFCENREGRLSL